MNHLTFFEKKLLLCSLFFIFSSCTTSHPSLFTPHLSPMFYDDGAKESLLNGLSCHEEYLLRLDDSLITSIEDRSVPVTWLRESLATFREIVELEPSPFELNRMLHENFDIFQAGGRANRQIGEMLFTGYYEPLLHGSLEKSPPYIYPIYNVPDDLVVLKGLNGNNQIGRYVDGDVFLPYYSRQEIEETDVLQGHEIVYLKDRFDAFLLHVQGSGRIQLKDGTVRSIQYRGNNGFPYASIGKYLVDTEKIQLKDVDIPAIRNYLNNHPHELKQILYHNPRYIFFGWGKTKGAVGSSGCQLTPGRSIAIDPQLLPDGAIGYLVTRVPRVNENGEITSWKIFHRFVLPQDTGSAIKGTGRVDIFWGSDHRAEKIAGVMKEKGKLYFLIKNNFEIQDE